MLKGLVTKKQTRTCFSANFGPNCNIKQKMWAELIKLLLPHFSPLLRQESFLAIDRAFNNTKWRDYSCVPLVLSQQRSFVTFYCIPIKIEATQIRGVVN